MGDDRKDTNFDIKGDYHQQGDLVQGDKNVSLEQQAINVENSEIHGVVNTGEITTVQQGAVKVDQSEVQGSIVTGTVNTGGGDYVGRDKITQYITIGVTHLTLRQKLTLSFLLLFVFIGLPSIYWGYGYLYPTQMTGDFRVAVAQFNWQGEGSDISFELSDGIALKLEENLATAQQDLTITVWGPNQVGMVNGLTPEERATAAAGLAEKIGADIVIYGVMDASNSNLVTTPEFYISDKNLVDAQEITGQHQLGLSFLIPGAANNTATRVNFSNKLTGRTALLSELIVGLAYYSAHEYELALTSFQKVETSEIWQEVGGKEVLYLLLGNAFGKSKQWAEAELAFNESIKLDGEYARAYVGLAGIYYAYALSEVAQENGKEDFSKLNLEQLNHSIDLYNHGLAAKNQPALSNIEAKVHFGLGQCYFIADLANGSFAFELAIKEFSEVVTAYGDGANPRIKEITAESHARLGLIYYLLGDYAAAKQEYEQAIELLADQPGRQEVFKDRLNEIDNLIPQDNG